MLRELMLLVFLCSLHQGRAVPIGGDAVTKADIDCLKQNLTNLQNSLTQQLEDIHDAVAQLPVFSCGGTGGWRQVAYLDMSDPESNCPSGWRITDYSTRTCGRLNTGRFTCSSATFSVIGGEYSKVCGRIKAYQWGAAGAFLPYHGGVRTTIESAYVDGVSLTHGSPRHHVWTMVDFTEEGHSHTTGVCPCDATRTINIPPFVGDSYFCESGINRPWNVATDYSLHSDDILWDGEDCVSTSTCCSLHNPPFFVKDLLSSTSDDIEARICANAMLIHEDIAVELVELYVK